MNRQPNKLESEKLNSKTTSSIGEDDGGNQNQVMSVAAGFGRNDQSSPAIFN